MKISPIAYKICQSRHKILLNTQQTIQQWSKAFKFCRGSKMSPNLVTLVPTTPPKKKTLPILACISLPNIWPMLSASSLLPVFQIRNPWTLTPAMLWWFSTPSYDNFRDKSLKLLFKLQQGILKPIPLLYLSLTLSVFISLQVSFRSSVDLRDTHITIVVNAGIITIKNQIAIIQFRPKVCGNSHFLS